MNRHSLGISSRKKANTEKKLSYCSPQFQKMLDNFKKDFDD